jgi:hypothetical protein
MVIVLVQGGFLYDENEVVALPLCQEVLGFCMFTAEVKSLLVELFRGYFLQYKGTKKQKRDRMMLA